MKFASVAVITRTKDRPTFLKRALQSVHSQTYKDLVHVIYNDGGDKEPLERLIELQPAEIRSKISVIHGDGSKGKEDSLFNPAIRSVDSTYVALHDDDDTWHRDFLKKTVELLQESSCAGVVARTDKVVEEIRGDTINQLKTTQWMPDLKYINLYRQCTENQMTAITFIYRRDVYEQIGGYDDNLAVCGDWDFGIRFLLHSDVEYLDPGYPLAFYHHRKYKAGAEGNTSATGENRFGYYTNYLLNKYLRDEVNEGRFGVGYIMSQHRFNESYMNRMVQKIVPNKIAKKIKSRFQA